MWKFRFLIMPIILMGVFGLMCITSAHVYYDEIVPLRDTVLFEARGEVGYGQYMVGYVTIKRASENRSYWGGSTIRGVVYYDCQFEWTCRDDLAPPTEAELERADLVARAVRSGKFNPPDPLARARYYLNPFASWLKQEDRCWFALNLVRVGVVGNHYFYAEPEEGEVFPVDFGCMPLPRPKPAPEPTPEHAAQAP